MFVLAIVLTAALLLETLPSAPDGGTCVSMRPQTSRPSSVR
jgi:hypothetical protein